MPRNTCPAQALPLLVIATLSLTVCATVPSRPSVVCPLVVAYDRAFQHGLPRKSSAMVQRRGQAHPERIGPKKLQPGDPTMGSSSERPNALNNIKNTVSRQGLLTLS